MSTPAAGGRQFTLTPNANATLLDDNVTQDTPVTVINTGTVRVYLAGDSNSSPNTALPLEGGTAQQWTTPGQLWAFVVDGSDPVEITTTLASADYTPSPFALAGYAAGQTAAQLLATGVPDVLRQTVLLSNALVSAAQPVTVDISGYASISIYVSAGNSLVNAVQNDAAGNTVDVENFGAFESALWRVVGSTLSLSPQGASARVYVVGSNRTAQVRLDARMTQSRGETFTTGVDEFTPGPVTFTPGQAQPMWPHVLGMLAGPVAVYASLSGTTVKGRWQVRDATTNDLLMILADTGEAHVDGSGNTCVRVMTAVPFVPYSIEFYCQGTGGTASSTIYLQAAQV